LYARELLIGALQTLPSTLATEVALRSGFDFIIIDCEHGVIDEPAQIASLQIISSTDALAVVRVRPRDFNAVSRYLDFGADAILLANVQTPDDASQFVAAGAHWHDGTRSSSVRTRLDRFDIESDPRWSIASRPPPALLAMIEGRAAVNCIDAIAATPGLTGLVIGPNDLAADLDCPNDFTSPVYEAAFAAIEHAASRADLLLGSKVHPGFPAERLVQNGHRFILASSDSAALRHGFQVHLKAARTALPSRTDTP
jgi:4-hydroxy-2-oxoheptanedioate aldolase